jgi:hypothetical protein
MTFFVTLLGDTDKADALKAKISEGHGVDVFHIDPKRFAKIPGCPFAYWAAPRFVELFGELQQFASDDRVAVTGMQTNDNGRWARLLWEGESARGGLQLVSFAKGGSHSPYYFETYIGLRWGTDGRALKEWKLDELSRGRITANNSRCWNEQYYFRPGLTWPMRSRKFAPQPLPRGCIFSIRGSSAFVPEHTLLPTLAIFNSRPFDYMYKLMLGRFGFPEFITGALARMPWPEVPDTIGKRLSDLALRQWKLRRTLYASSEISPAFILPRKFLKRLDWPSPDQVNAEQATIQSEIDSLCCQIYAIGPTEQAEMDRWLSLNDASPVAENESDTDSDDEQEEIDQVQDADDDYAALSWAFGVCFGRFDIRIASGERSLPPDPGPFDPIPERSPGMILSDGPRFLESNGILVDDPGHSLDLVACIRGVFEDLEEAAPAQEEIRAYFRSSFFPEHLKKYSKNLRKAPIYWHFATASAGYSVWLYVHEITGDTLYKVQNDYVEKKLGHEERRLASVRQELGDNLKAAGRNILAAQEAFVEELRELLEEFKRVTPLWSPSLDDGIILTMAPLWRLVPQHRPWQKELKSKWDELAAGKYDWAHIAMHLWPERVVSKCATDRSLAIAHGLEDVFWAKVDDGKWMPRATSTRSIDELVHERTSVAVKAALKGLTEASAPSGPKARTRRSSS